MSLYDTYRHLEKLPYIDGSQDCYGLVRRYYREQYGMVLTNYARPIGFDRAGLMLLTDNFMREGFTAIDCSWREIQIGDLFLMNIASRHGANHIGVYVGNGYMLHHLYKRPSAADALDERWKSRVLNILRHPDVMALNNQKLQQTDVRLLLPPHLRSRFEDR